MQSSNKQIKKNDLLVVASHNEGKIIEFKTLLSKFKIKILTSRDLNIQDVKETGTSFKENSILKVNSIPNKYIAISDDSGLCVKNLDNKPGIFSSRYQKACGGWFNAMKQIYDSISRSEKPDFSAKFFCALSIKFKDQSIFSYSGEIKGLLTWPPRGNNGFGYDPFFVPNGYTQTFGEMSHHKKILMDHRSVALGKLIKSHLSDS